MVCPDCGAHFSNPADSCQQRFEHLLALDHSRAEPWGSRHGVAFAVYALQHPSTHSDATRTLAREMLRRVFVDGEPPERVVADLRERQLSPRMTVPAADVPPRGGRFEVTIADLGDFAAEGYPSALTRWALATLRHVA